MLWVLSIIFLAVLQIARALRGPLGQVSRHEPNHLRSLPKPSQWDVYSAKGRRYYNIWLQKTGADTLLPFWIDDNTPTITKETLTLEEELFLGSNGYHTDWNDYLEFDMIIPYEPPTAGKVPASFTLSASSMEGILVVRTAYWREAKQGRSLSDIMWWCWTKAVQGIDDCPGDGKISGLSSIWRITIVNETTISFLNYALQGSADTVHSLRPDDQSDDNAFWPLLGSANGVGIIWLLIDHKLALRGKGLERLAIEKKHIVEDYYVYSMWAGRFDRASD